MSARFEGVSKSYGSVVALAELDLLVDDGELLTVVGPSGCGKTTALRLLAGLEDPTAGRVHVGGRDVTDAAAAPPRRRDGVPGPGAVPAPDRAREHRVRAADPRREPDARPRRRVDELGERLGLTTALDRYPGPALRR